MNILYLITGLGGGGAEKVVVDLADQMHLRGHRVKIAYLKGEVIVKPQSADIELICLELNRITQMRHAFKKFKSIIKQFKPDVVHAHMVHANIFARLVRKFIGFPRLICTAHNSNEGGRMRMMLYRFTDILSDLNTNVSHEATLKFVELKAFNENAKTVYNGIDLNKFNRKANLCRYDFVHENQKFLLAVGRFNEQKDYPNLLDAIYTLKNKFKLDFKLIIAGDGELRFNIENKINLLGLNQDVILLGRRNDIADLMSVADLFVLPSAWEGFGLVVAEAMACECFVVATDCGGVKEVLGGHGLLVEPRNSDQLADALNTALQLDRKTKDVHTQQALLYVKQNFDLQKIIKQWLDIYAN
ncbi:glycosyltransferase [Acinetobacter nosocomialis]|uniref:glycosyltransferase n=1 Tax=Acinetobacter nosocomialis TaxID=106654 RepID=UPI000DE61345|nr:glycosyltransferase [Acinetobacter nosocomialis]SSV33240.1 glycosyl transferase family protein [Acinetobacter nosocomialis]